MSWLFTCFVLHCLQHPRYDDDPPPFDDIQPSCSWPSSFSCYGMVPSTISFPNSICYFSYNMTKETKFPWYYGLHEISRLLGFVRYPFTGSLCDDEILKICLRLFVSKARIRVSFPFLKVQLLHRINVKKLFSLEHSVRALNHTSKTAQIILARTLDRTHWLPLHT